jgi:hypothetical protein
VHADQLTHIRKGCLERKRQDIASDGSRIEGSHKGWNSLQRTHASGIVMFEALAHDFVLRRNLRIGFSHMNEGSDPFLLSTQGSHHTSLVDHIAEIWNTLISSHKRALGLPKRPRLPTVDSGETFGLIDTTYTTTFDALFEVKKEERDSNETWLLPPQSDEVALDDVLERLGIDTEKLTQPLIVDMNATRGLTEPKPPQVQATAAALAVSIS